jgi:acetoin utilization protein AcuB
MLMPPISRYMTRQPWTIRRDAPLTQAMEMMREHQVRHLPVLDAGALVGLVSERDILRFDRLRRADDRFTVEDAMTEDVYSARGEQTLEEVVDAMAEHRYGSVVIVNRCGTVEGIFTTVDAMQVLGELLRRVAA